MAALISFSFVSFLDQQSNALVIRAIVKESDSSPSYRSNLIDYNMRNINITDTPFPTRLNDTSDNIPTVSIDPNSIFINGVLTSKTSPVDSNKSSVWISLQTTNIRNGSNVLSMTASGNYPNLIRLGPPNFEGRFDYNKQTKEGLLQIGPPDKVDDYLYFKIFKLTPLIR